IIIPVHVALIFCVESNRASFMPQQSSRYCISLKNIIYRSNHTFLYIVLNLKGKKTFMFMLIYFLITGDVLDDRDAHSCIHDQRVAPLFFFKKKSDQRVINMVTEDD
ncbi:hypothetical protein ACJX0J_019829, partial [Zea mays]